MYTINAIFEDIERVSCEKVYIKLYDNKDELIHTGFVKTATVLPYITNKHYNIHSACGIQIDAIVPIQDYIGEEILQLLILNKL